MDKSMYLWTTQGEVVHKWTGARVTDLAATPDGTRLVAICHERKIRVYGDIQRHKFDELFVLSEPDAITSLALSTLQPREQPGRYFVVNVANQEVHLWDLVERKLVRKMTGQKQGKFVIRSTFGGVDENFVISGSEGKEMGKLGLRSTYCLEPNSFPFVLDNIIYVWHRDHGVLIETLSGHDAVVNSVSWCRGRNLFASASDDHTIRM
jgi:WD40 repeat protein